MKKLNKVASLILVLILLLSCVSETLAASSGSEIKLTKPNAVVLVLDVSGSMDGNRIIKLKEATNKFAEKLIEGGANNKIAVVTFANNCSILSFTNDLTEIKRFMSTKTAHGGTDMTSGINNADSLLSNEELTNYNKSIVIMSDGGPNNINSAKSAATALFGKYNIYSVGLNLSSSQKAFMQSIQNKGYFDADSVDDLVKKFIEVVEEILYPLEILLKNECVSSDVDKSQNGKVVYVYEITATIKNRNSREVKNCVALFSADENIEIIEGTAQTDMGTIASHTSKTLKWKISCVLPIFTEISAKTYSLKVTGEYKEGEKPVEILASDKLIITDPFAEKDNRLIFNKDVWSFKNYGGPIKINTVDMNALIANLDEIEIKRIQDFIDGEQNYSDEEGGHCYGMSVTTILTKMGIINPCTRTSRENTLNGIKFSENIDSLISYYQTTFELNAVINEEAMWKSLSPKEKIEKIINLTSNVEFGKSPVLIWLSYPGLNKKNEISMDVGSGHAVVGYEYEPGNYTYKGHNYTGRVLLYDCNLRDSFSDKNYLYLNNDGSWSFTYYEYANNYSPGAELTLCTNKTSVLDNKDIETSVSNYLATISAKRLINLSKIKTKTASINAKEIYKNPNISISVDPMGDNSRKNIDIINPEECYQLEVNDKKQGLDYTMNYKADKSVYLSACASNAKSVDFYKDGTVAINENESDFKMSTTLDNSPLSSCSTIEVSGNGTTNPKLRVSNDGFVFEGDKIKNVIIKAYEPSTNSKKYVLNIETNEKSVLVFENNGSLIAAVDKDNDGTYETTIASSDKDNSAKLDNLETKGFKLTPTFNPALQYYISFVSDSVSKVSMIPTMSNGTAATISVNGSKEEAFNSEYGTELKTGINVVKVKVTDAEGNSKEYILTIVKGLWSIIKPGLMLTITVSVAIIKVVVQYLIHFFKFLL